MEQLLANSQLSPERKETLLENLAGYLQRKDAEISSAKYNEKLKNNCANWLRTKKVKEKKPERKDSDPALEAENVETDAHFEYVDVCKFINKMNDEAVNATHRDEIA